MCSISALSVLCLGSVSALSGLYFSSIRVSVSVLLVPSPGSISVLLVLYADSISALSMLHLGSILSLSRLDLCSIPALVSALPGFYPLSLPWLYPCSIRECILALSGSSPVLSQLYPGSIPGSPGSVPVIDWLYPGSRPIRALSLALPGLHQDVLSVSRISHIKTNTTSAHRSFSYAAPSVWNSLPHELRHLTPPPFSVHYFS